MKQNQLKTTAIFKCIVTLKNGAHMIIRMTVDKVAKLVAMFRTQQKCIFCETQLFSIGNDEYLALSNVYRCKFINERTGEEFLTLA